MKIIALLLLTGSMYATTVSFYHDKYDKKLTASGIIFNQRKMYAAHCILPFGTKVRITNLTNHKSVIVTVVDRGPFLKTKHGYKRCKSRLFDLSTSAFRKIGSIRQGVLKIKYKILK
jgi:rare lipoprotein A